jgi:hypothetical protein
LPKPEGDCQQTENIRRFAGKPNVSLVGQVQKRKTVKYL